MKLVCCFAFLIILLVGSGTSAQDRTKAYEVPLKYFSFWLLNNADCPIQISNPKVYAEESGSLHYSYTISNTTDKSIKSLVIRSFDAFENPSYGSTPNLAPSDEFAFVPYDRFSLIGENWLDIKPLTSTQAAKFKLSESRKRFWIVIVTKVELHGGKPYDASEKYARIKKFIDTTEDRSYDWDSEKVLLTFDDKSELLRKFITAEIQKNSDFLKLPND